MSVPRDPRTIPALTTLVVVAALFTGTFLLVSGTFPSEEDPGAKPLSLSLSLLHFDYFVERPLDTLFVLDTCYLDVNLDSQQVVQHCKNGTSKTMLCSTGNKKIKKAIETTEGIFCVQSKSPIAISRQFDSTKMFFWVGFNGNIGFHGLDGKSYYRFLGKRPSSHGCIRMSREDAEWMFRHIPIGTPVIVHTGSAARCLAFRDSIPPNGVHIQSDHAVRRTMEVQLRTLYRGRQVLDGMQPFYFSKSSLWWGGIPIGDITQVPVHARPAPFSSGARVAAEGDVLTYRHM